MLRKSLETVVVTDADKFNWSIHRGVSSGEESGIGFYQV